jgi:hypothetical protein
MKLKPCVDGNDNLWGYAFFCVGCEHAHVFSIAGNKIWTFDGNVEMPTFTPSLLNDSPDQRCHLNLTKGKIQYHLDCSHDMKGKLIDLPEMPF